MNKKSENWGGKRQGAGAKPTVWPKGTKLKVMKLPEKHETEIKAFAFELVTNSIPVT